MLASLRLNGWWNSLSRCLVAGSMGPRFLSATRRVFSIGRLVSATSAWSDKGPAGSRRGWRNLLIASVINKKKDMHQHWESQKWPWLPFLGWRRSPPDAGLKSVLDGKLSASPRWRQCTSPNSASPVRKKTTCINKQFYQEWELFIGVNAMLWI